jgi:hypothetical protein
MEALLERIIDAHGGSARWEKFTDFITDVNVQGNLCELGGMPGIIGTSRLILSLRSPQTIVLLPDGQGRLVINPDSISNVDVRGVELQDRSSPRDIINRVGPFATSSVFRTGYFLGFIVRYAVMSPFLYALEGFSLKEVEPWNERGEPWRVLKVTFPVEHHAPFRVQYAYYGADGLLRRTRNSGTLFGDDIELINDVTAYGTVNGIQMPISREIFKCSPAGVKIDEAPVARIELVEPFFTD